MEHRGIGWERTKNIHENDDMRENFHRYLATGQGMLTGGVLAGVPMSAD